MIAIRPADQLLRRPAQSKMGQSTTGRVAALAAALLLMSSCALLPGVGDGSGEVDPLRAEPIETTGGGLGDDRSAAADAALAAARQAWRDGDALGVMAVVTRALQEGVPESYETPLRALRSQAREALLDRQVARLAVLPNRDAVTDGMAIEGTVRLRNLSSAPLMVPVTADASSASQIVLEVVREDWDLYGNVRTTEFSVRVPLETDLHVGPGGELAVPISIPAEHARLSHTGFAVLRIGGHLRAVAIRVGATEFFDALELDPGVVRVFMDGWEQLADEPFRSVERAVAKRAPAHLLTAVELLAPGERSAAVTLLARAAEDDPPLAWACRAAMARLNRLLESAQE